MTRLLAREDLLWCRAVRVSPQALSKRFLVFPAELFERVLKDLLPLLQERWQARLKRPIPEAVKVAQQTFQHIWIVEGSTLEALFRKLESSQDVPLGQLAGKIGAVIDLVTRFPMEIWYREGARATILILRAKFIQSQIDFHMALDAAAQYGKSITEEALEAGVQGELASVQAGKQRVIEAISLGIITTNEAVAKLAELREQEQRLTIELSSIVEKA